MDVPGVSGAAGLEAAAWDAAGPERADEGVGEGADGVDKAWAGGQTVGMQGGPNCLPNSRLAWIRLYCISSFKVWERHSGVLQFTSQISLREWERFKISRDVMAMLTSAGDFLYIIFRQPPDCAGMLARC